MLLFELFPLFVALVSIVAGVWLFMLNLDADPGSEPPGPANQLPSTASERSNKRPVRAPAQRDSRRP
jgi:hypothetical protein